MQRQWGIDSEGLENLVQAAAALGLALRSGINSSGYLPQNSRMTRAGILLCIVTIR